MKVLVLAQVLPDPPDSGPKVKTAAVLRHLAGGHDVTLAAFTRGDESAAEERLRGVVAAVHTVPIRRGWPRDAWYLGRSLIAGESFLLARDERRAMRRLVDGLATTGGFDVVHVDQLNMARYAPRRPGQARVLDAHNALWVVVERLAQTMPRGLRRRLLEREVRLLRAFEGRTCREFDAVVAVSEEDADALRQAAEEPVAITVVPIAIDTERTLPVARDANAGRILHVGSLLWPPTADGLRWFLDEVWPRLRERRPDLEIDVVGPRPPADIAARDGRDLGVRVHGFVGDLAPLLRSAAVMVVPLRAGGGMRVRILNGLAQEVPIVTTPLGVEGIAAIHDRHLLVADGAAEFCAAVERLLADPALGARLGRAGRELVRERYDYREACRQLDGVYETAVARARRALEGAA